jgi:hypothetical protein
VFLFAFLVILRINGLNLGNIALSVTVFSAVMGVILAPIVGSVISGVFLLADQPYEIGDMIELAGDGEAKRGFVEDITLRYTKIFTLDNTFLVIPNGNIRERDVYNYSAEDARIRRTLDVLVTYESDIAEAQRLLERSARKTDGIIEGGPRIRIGAARYPARPDCLIGTFGDHGVLLRLRYWLEEPYRLQTIRSNLQERVRAAMEDADVEIAYLHSHLHFNETSGHLEVAMAGDAAEFRDAPGPDRRRRNRGIARSPGADGHDPTVEFLLQEPLDVGVVDDPADHLPPPARLFFPDDDHVRVLGSGLLEDGLLDEQPLPDDVPRPLRSAERLLDGGLESCARDRLPGPGRD